MTDQLLDDKDLDLSPDLMCLVLHRRSRIAAMAAASSRTTAVGEVVESCRDHGWLRCSE